MLYFKKLLGFLQRKIGPFSSREILFWLWGLRPRPKLPRPWAGPAICHSPLVQFSINSFFEKRKKDAKLVLKSKISISKKRENDFIRSFEEDDIKT